MKSFTRNEFITEITTRWGGDVSKALGEPLTSKFAHIAGLHEQVDGIEDGVDGMVFVAFEHATIEDGITLEKFLVAGDVST